MKNVSSMHLLFAVALAGLLAAGCAQKPTPSAAAVALAPTATSKTPAPSVKKQAVSQAPASAAEQLQMIHFAFNAYTLPQDSRDVLVKDAAWLKTHPEVKVRIEGNCDERGSETYNLALGQKRAVAAQKYLVTLGIHADRISVISYGNERPLDPAHNEAAWAKNRRDEFHPLD